MQNMQVEDYRRRRNNFQLRSTFDVAQRTHTHNNQLRWGRVPTSFRQDSFWNPLLPPPPPPPHFSEFLDRTESGYRKQRGNDMQQQGV